MRNGSEKRRPLCVESLEERNAPATVLPSDAAVPAPPVVETPRGGGIAQVYRLRGHDSLTLAIVTDMYPLPVELDRPGIVTPRPYSGDPIAIYTVVSY